jgi:Immunoglobulin domain/Immunoglobulin I-set domain
VAAGESFSMALRDDGTVVEWGPGPVAASPPDNLVAIAAGDSLRLGLREDGTVVSWGSDNSNPSPTSVPTNLPPVIGIAAARNSGLGLIPASAEPHIARQPRNQRLFTGQNLLLETSVFPGAAPVRYQWFHDGVEIIGATQAVLNVSAAARGDAGRYYARVTNDYGGEISREVAIEVIEQAPAILAQPVDVVSYRGGAASFTVSAEGSSPLGIQWMFKGAAIPGATNAALTLPNVSASDAGSYQAVLNNKFGIVTSSAASLTLALGISLEQTTVRVSSAGGLAFTIRLSEPWPNDIRVHLVYGPNVFLYTQIIGEAFVSIAAGSVEQCAEIVDAGLVAVLTGNQSVKLFLLDPNVGTVLAVPAATLLLADPDHPASKCTLAAGEPARFLPGALQRQSDGSVEIQFTLPPNQSFTVESSTDLMNWAPVDGTFASDRATRVFWFLDLSSGGDAARFYRVRSD